LATTFGWCSRLKLAIALELVLQLVLSQCCKALRGKCRHL
jgi:hypothetical protein